MQADDDVPTLWQLFEREALQHDVEQAEHHRQADDDNRPADDDRDPYDAAARDLLDCLRRHKTVFRDALITGHDGRSYGYVGENHLSERRLVGALVEYRFVTAGDGSS